MAEDFWYNEKRLPELRPDGTWKKKVSAKSGTNQSYNEVKVKANVGVPSLTKTKQSMAWQFVSECPVGLLCFVGGVQTIICAPEVLEIVQVDQANENFCAIFTLDFAYVDPTLSWKLPSECFPPTAEAEGSAFLSGRVCISPVFCWNCRSWGPHLIVLMFCCGCGSILMVSSQETQSKVMFFCVTGPGARTLRKTYVKTAYLDKDGKVKEEFAQVWGTTRSASREAVLVLKVVLKVKDDQSSDDENPPYVYVRKSDLLSIEPVKWKNHMALDPCLVGMNINERSAIICLVFRKWWQKILLEMKIFLQAALLVGYVWRFGPTLPEVIAFSGDSERTHPGDWIIPDH